MSTIVKGLKREKTTPSIEDCFGFIDSNNNVFLVGDEGAILDISSPDFLQYKASGYDSIEEFLCTNYNTQLVKVLEKLTQFDIEVIIK